MQIIKLDISRYDVPETLCAKQGDVGRCFQVVLTDSGEDYPIPEGAWLSAWYSGTSGSGNFSAIGEKCAFAVNGNTVTVELIAQMLQNRGGGNLCVILHSADGSQLGLWNIPYVVEGVPGMDSSGATQYYTALSETATLAAASAEKAETAARKLVIDSSLTKAGQAADAANTGDAIRRAEANITALQANSMESEEHPGCYYRIVEGEAEWINPPILIGTAYRTTRRWQGMPVYERLLDCGYVGSSGTYSVSNPISNGIILSYEGYIASGNSYRTLPVSVCGAFVQDSSILFSIANEGYIGWRILLKIKYHKV